MVYVILYIIYNIGIVGRYLATADVCYILYTAPWKMIYRPSRYTDAVNFHLLVYISRDIFIVPENSSIIIRASLCEAASTCIVV